MEPSALIVLERAQKAGLTVWIDGGDLKAKGQPTPQAKAAVEYLNEYKSEVITYLRQKNFADWMERLMNRADY